MILIGCKGSEKEVIIGHYPDGTLKINLPTDSKGGDLWWRYEKEEEFSALIFIAMQSKNMPFRKFSLIMPYVPNARMDRIHNNNEVFTLKSFASIINSLGFERVTILDPHSNVTPALFNNVEVLSPEEYINSAIAESARESNVIDPLDVVLYFPDEGAMKRYSGVFPQHKFIYGEKKRDWETGKILGLDIRNPYNLNLNGKTVLMIDDIIAYGGSLHFSALKLKELGVGTVFAYATHTENSILDKEFGTLIKDLENGTVERLFTTDSLFNKEHDKVETFKIFE